MQQAIDHATSRPIRPRRGTKVATIGFGAALCALLGTGLVALTSDTARSTGNDVRSGSFTPPPPPEHDLDIALVSPSTAADPCADARFEEATSAAFVVTSTNVDLDSGEMIDSDSDFCLKNAGSAPGRLTVRFTGVTDFEVGCSPGESTLGADTSCGTGAGELRPMLQPSIVALGTISDCTGADEAAWSDYETAQVLDIALAPSEICRVHLTLFQTPGASDAQKSAAQTDDVRWDVSFTLSD